MIATYDEVALLQPVHRPTSDLIGPPRLVTKPVGQVVERREVKEQGRIVSLTNDSVIDRAIVTATDFCERSISGHRQFLTAQYAVPVRGFWYGPLKLPRPPLQSVDGIYYYDTSGVQQALATTTYIVETPWQQPGTVTLAPSQSWPSVQSEREYPVEIRFTCGYGTAKDVPPLLKYAVIVAASQIYWSQQRVNQETTDSVEQFLEANYGYGSFA